ncbi:MAG: abortive infection family protein [Cyclobacteriaceae bacterium]
MEEDLKDRIFGWLMDTEEEAAAEFINECDLKLDYVDVAFSLSNLDKEVHFYDAHILTPAKFYVKLKDYEDLTSKIEETAKELSFTEGILIKEVLWLPGKTKYNRDRGKNSDKIVTILNDEYVRKQVRLMDDNINDNPHLTIGIAKELIETVCKTILLDKGIEIDRNWDVGRIVKETNKLLKFIPDDLHNNDVAERAILKILGGLSTIVQGIAELRNNFGSGHGHEAEFKSIEKIYAKLAADSSSQLVLLYLKVNTETKIVYK